MTDTMKTTAPAGDAELTTLADEWFRLENASNGQIVQQGRAWEAAGRPDGGEDTSVSDAMLRRQGEVMELLVHQPAASPKGLQAKAQVLTAWVSGANKQPMKSVYALAWSLAQDLLAEAQA